jgi:hypothetical protein
MPRVVVLSFAVFAASATLLGTTDPTHAVGPVPVLATVRPAMTTTMPTQHAPVGQRGHAVIVAPATGNTPPT